MAPSATSTSTWSLDYSNSSSRSKSSSSNKSIPDPPGYNLTDAAGPLKKSSKSPQPSAAAPPARRKTLPQLRAERAWTFATSPAKQVPMQGFMMYMSGGGVQIFSMMMVWMLIKNAIGAMLGVNKAFTPYGSPVGTPNASSLIQQKAVYVLCQGLLLALGLYKCHSMGLLPTAASDWLAFREHVKSLDLSSVSLGP